MYEIALMSYRYSSDSTVFELNGMAHGTLVEKKYVNGARSTLKRYQTCRRQATNETMQERRLKICADVTIYATASYAKLDWC